MNKETVLVVGSSSFESLWNYSCSDRCKIRYAFRGSKSKIVSYIRMLWLRYDIPGKKIWYKGMANIENANIILFDECIEKHYLLYLKSCVASGINNRLIFYYWNPISKKSVCPDFVKAVGYEAWSFDASDCERYEMKYNPQLFFYSWYKINSSTNIGQKSDLVFVGRDKNGRMGEMNRLKQVLREHNVQLECYFTAHKWYKRFSSREYKPYLDFKKMIAKECESKAILDYSISGQSGNTLRVYDALINSRKVVTNNREICDLPIYSKENVFILDRDKLEDLRAFLDAPFKEIDKKAIEECSEIGWLRRFG